MKTKIDENGVERIVPLVVLPNSTSKELKATAQLWREETEIEAQLWRSHV